MFYPGDGYIIEGYYQDENGDEVLQEEPEQMDAQAANRQQLFEWAAWYGLYFYQQPHKNFLVRDNNKKYYIVSIKSENHQYRMLLRSDQHTEGILVPKGQFATPIWRRLLGLGASVVDMLEKAKAPLKFSCEQQISAGEAISKRLLSLDQPGHGKPVHVGIVYCEHDQTEENEFFSNVNTSTEFDEFLEFMGTIIELKGWPHHAGGLDVTKGRSGEHSLYTTWDDREVMFHVSTMLPLYSSDPQQIERKKHIGNDRAIIVFKDGDAPYKVDAINSKTNHILVLIQTVQSDDGKTMYRLGFARKDSVPFFGEPFQFDRLHEKTDELRRFLFSKIFSGLDACHYATGFQQLRLLYYRSTISSIISDYS